MKLLTNWSSLDIRVDRKPIRCHNQSFYHIDGLPRTEEQIISHLLHGTPLYEQISQV